MPSSSELPGIVSIWAYLEGMKEYEEFTAETLDSRHYSFMKWDGKLWVRNWNNESGRYEWELWCTGSETST